MPTEAELRDLLRDEPHEPGSLDTARIIRRARARRRPKQLALGLAGGLAAVAVVVPVALGIGSAPLGIAAAGGSAADQSAEQSGGSVKMEDAPNPDAATVAAPPAAQLNACAGPVAEPVPDPSGLVLTVQSVDAAAESAWIEATVTLRNTSDVTVSGTTGGAPALTLAQNGLVLWHSNGPTTMIAVPVDLAPGASMEYTASFAPARCAPEDDGEAGFREGLPQLGAGEYELSAAIDLVPLDGGPSRLVTGAATTITLH